MAIQLQEVSQALRARRRLEAWIDSLSVDETAKCSLRRLPIAARLQAYEIVRAMCRHSIELVDLSVLSAYSPVFLAQKGPNVVMLMALDRLCERTWGSQLPPLREMESAWLDENRRVAVELANDRDPRARGDARSLTQAAMNAAALVLFQLIEELRNKTCSNAS